MARILGTVRVHLLSRVPGREGILALRGTEACPASYLSGIWVSLSDKKHCRWALHMEIGQLMQEVAFSACIQGSKVLLIEEKEL